MKAKQNITLPKSNIISNLVRNKLKQVKISKLSVQDKKNWDFAKTRLKTVINEESDSDSSNSCSFREPVKEVTLSAILKSIDDLSSELDQETKTILKCSTRMSLNSEIFWTSPTAILRAIKNSILLRNWEDVTHLLLLLLQHNDHYIPIVQSLCGFMAKFNPLVKKLGLQKQFEILNVRRVNSEIP